MQLLESRGWAPDAFIDSLWSYVSVASDFDIAMGGASLADSFCSLRYPDPLHPAPGPSHGGDSIVPFLYHIGVSPGSSSALVTMSASALRYGGSGVSSGVGLGSTVPPPSSSLSNLPIGSSFPAPSSFPLIPRLLAFRLLLPLAPLFLFFLLLLLILAWLHLSPTPFLLFLLRPLLAFLWPHWFVLWLLLSVCALPVLLSSLHRLLLLLFL